MANPILSQPELSPKVEAVGPTELRIQIWVDYWTHFEGTAAQLSSEGLIPEGFVWPRGDDSVRWDAGRFSYWLRRSRPQGHKGTKRSWQELDNWFVRVEVTDRSHDWQVQRQLQRKADALAEEIYSHTAEGKRLSNARWERLWKTREDRAFQDFKARVLPEKKKPGRKVRALPEEATPGAQK